MNSRKSTDKCRWTSMMKGLHILSFSLVIAGCSSNPLTLKTQQKAPVVTPPSDVSSIAVIPNPYVDDITLANKATEEAKQELIKRGYRVVSSETEADLVGVPTVETNAIRLVTVAKPFDLLAVDGQAEPQRSLTVANSLGSLGSSVSQSSSGTVGDGKPSLVIEAFRKEAWEKALIVNELQLQPAWKIRMPLPASLKPSLEGAQIARTADTDFVLPH